MRIAVSQINTNAGDFSDTIDRISNGSYVAEKRGCDLLVFGICTLTGPTVVDYSVRQDYLIDLFAALEELAERVSCACLVPLVLPLDSPHPYGAALLRDGQVELVSFDLVPSGPKKGSETELRLRQREGLSRLELFGSKVGIAYTYAELEEWCDEPKVDVILFLNSFSYANDDPASAMGAAIEEGGYDRIALDTDAWIVCANSVGCYGNLVFCGASFVLAPDARLAASVGPFEENFIMAEVGAGAVLERGSELSPELYDERFFTWQSVTLGIRDYVQKNYLMDVALLVDGSISSMFLAVAATDALGPTHVHVLLGLPKGSPRAEEAKRLVRALRVHAQTAPIGNVDDEELAYDLAQAHLAALARETNALPLCSLDKTALALELRHAQAEAGRFAPLGDLYRSSVINVTRMRNTISPILPSLTVLPEDVPEIEVIVDTWANEVLLNYIDSTLTLYIEFENSLSDVCLQMTDADVAEAVLVTYRSHDARRVALPECLALSSKALVEAINPTGLDWFDAPRPNPDKRLQEAYSKLASVQSSSELQGRRIREATPEELEEHRSELMEAFELLRDLSMGSEGTWTDHFSEN